MAFVPCKLPKGADGDPEEFVAKLHAFGHNDMCMMPVLTKEEILANLLRRFQGEVVYTYVGDIVVSLNPFKNVGAVGKAIRAKYKRGKRQELPPHIYSLVGQTFGQMMTEGVSQSILISGESGAGKTEAMKICLTYIAELSKGGGGGGGGENDVAARLMQTNPVMEAIGNAKTIRNNNSSRFGKHFDVQFTADGAILGAHTSSYLLEKPRICVHMDGERNYHVFYMLCKVRRSSDPSESPPLAPRPSPLALTTSSPCCARRRRRCASRCTSALGRATRSASRRARSPR
jgi:myosin heavy subunit